MNTNILFTSLGKSKYKLIFWIIVAILALFTITPRGYAQSPEVTYPYKKVFVISAYYSPLENQSKYATGSYAGDIRLNGGGVHGADGTAVYPGMAAAGRMYSYGTKLKIPGFGTVAVHDRGGAIHDNRIDLWLGYGDEGLARALAWGKRSVEVTVYGVDKTVLEDVDFNSMPKANLAFLRVPSATTAVTPAVVTIQEPEIIQGTEGEHVRVIQYYLKKTGYFGGDLNGKFDEVTKNAILLFQKDRELIDNESNSGAGVFGPRTQNALIETVNLAQEQQLHSLPSQTLLKGSKGNEVTALQSVLEDFGYIAEVNGIFDSATVDGLTRLQLDLDVVTSTTAYGAGVYGAKTQSAMRDLIIKSWAVPTKSQLTSARPISATVGESLSFAESSPEVYKLQEFLFKTNFLRVSPTGFYGKTTEHAVMKFQQAFGIVADAGSQGAGVTGPRTLEKVNELIASRSTQIEQIAQKTDTQKLVAARLNEEKQLVADLAATHTFSASIAYGYRGDEVEKLQTVLMKLGFYNSKITTDYFGDATKNSLVSFQKSHGLTASGEVDEPTRAILNKLMNAA